MNDFYNRLIEKLHVDRCTHASDVIGLVCWRKGLFDTIVNGRYCKKHFKEFLLDKHRRGHE